MNVSRLLRSLFGLGKGILFADGFSKRNQLVIPPQSSPKLTYYGPVVRKLISVFPVVAYAIPRCRSLRLYRRQIRFK